MSPVPGDSQSGGPGYDFRIGQFEITNAQFVDFLNDALANPDADRGSWLYHATDTGSVYLNGSESGAQGPDVGGTYVFNASDGGRIAFNAGAYELIDPAYVDHPVVGVSWYGAVKYCNWLTLASGLSADQRIYTEASSANLYGWHPFTIDDASWATRDLTAQERADLLDRLGYRLPMDDDAGTEAAYNEWYKAAAWQPGTGTHSTYGFGRDTIVGADANYSDSGDPFDNSTTPVGYFDGSDHDGAFPTTDTANAYGLYDASGNVWEWMQDQRVSPDRRAVRGGSWFSGSSSLNAAGEAGRLTTATSDNTGFRIVQVVPHALLVTPEDTLVSSGTYGGEYDLASRQYTVTNVTDQSLLVSVTPDVSWVLVDGQTQLADLPLSAGAEVTVVATIAPTCGAEDLSVGLNTGTLVFISDAGPETEEREVRLTLIEPLALAPPSGFVLSGLLGGPFDPPDTVYTLTSASLSSVDWSAEVDADWISLNGLNGGETATGQIVPPATEALITVGLDPAVQLLPVGTHFAQLTFRDDCTHQTYTRLVNLEVQPAIDVTPATGGELSGIFPESSYTITNLSQNGVDWEAVVDDPEGRFLINGNASASGALASLDDTATVAVSPSATGMSLAPGVYSTTLRLRDRTDPDNIHEIVRTVTLTVSGLDATGPAGGPFAPAQTVYPVYNHSLPEMPWQATYETSPPGGTWLSLNGAASAFGTILDPGSTDNVTVAINGNAASLETGAYTAVVTFENLATGATSQRSVTLTVGRTFRVSMATIGEEDLQPGGPDYPYRLGLYELTNSEFAVFLNSALLHPGDERGAYLYHDVDSGDVYLHELATGDIGTDGAGTLLFDASLGGGITYSADDQRYRVVTGLAGHPIVGVSWFGAVKFCNWMTLAQGMTPAQRAYTEGPTPDDWFPVTTTKAQWLVGDLDAAQRAALATSVPGFRLPMDDEQGAASAYNEWHKAAAWLAGTETNSTYGFGRDTLTDSDANYLDSDDPHETDDPPLCPVRFFNGVSTLTDGETLTNDSANTYGLYDLCGNAAEWVQDQGVDPAARATRGGSAFNPGASTQLRNDTRTSLAADATRSYVGLRVAQSLVADPLEPTETDDFLADGTVGGPFTLSGSQGQYTLANSPAGSIEYSVTASAGWIDLNGQPSISGVLAPNETLDVVISLNEQAEALLEPGAPSVAMAIVPGEDTQPGGPAYDYRLSFYEVTNSQYATFLNDALVNLDNERGAYLYHDADSGDVFLHSEETGEIGTNGVGVPLFDAGSNARLTYNGSAYVVESGFETHPVTGVSWYGAVKFCNWLTLHEGLPPGQRAYTEGIDSGRWHPATIGDADWALRDLDPAEREALLSEHVGYRLPMDGQSIAADVHNEWHKAAAWLPDTSTNGLYGFGRSDIGTDGADANFLDSEDPFEPGTTPGGFFNGTLYNPGGSGTVGDGAEFQSSLEANGYGLVDLSGNVAEWVQDQGTGPENRGVRGGSFRDAIDSASLQTAHRDVGDPAGVADDLGFRVALGKRAHVATITFTDLTTNTQTLRYVVLTLAEPLTITPSTTATTSGPFRGPFTPLSHTYTLANGSASTVSWTAGIDAPWADFAAGDPDSGELTADEQIELEVVLSPDLIEALPPGTHSATVTFSNLTTGKTQIRNLELTVDEAISVLPEDDLTGSGLWGGPFSALSATELTVTNLMDFALDYEVTANVDWLTLNSGQPAAGRLDSQNPSAAIPIALNSNADALAIGEYEATVTIAFNDDAEVSGQVTRTVTLTVLDHLDVDPAGNVLRDYSPPADPAEIPVAAYTVTNLGDALIAWLATCDQSWVSIDGAAQASGDLPPTDTRQLEIGFNSDVLALGEGKHTAVVSIEDLLSGHVHTRKIRLTIDESLSVLPLTDFDTYGQAGRTIAPGQTVYTLTNRSDAPLDWQAAQSGPPVTWLRIDGQDQATGTLEVDEQVEVGLTIDQTLARGLAPGSHLTTVVFQNLTEGTMVAERSASVNLVVPLLTPRVRSVPGANAQPGGPTYGYQVGTYPVTNTEFVVFLNDALGALNTERGQYLYHDTDTGDVYINDVKAGQAGTDGSDTLGTKLFSAAANLGRITHNGSLYVISPGYEDHPVTGVSWYGAAKFCNWLTLDQGFGPAQRAYGEGTADDLADWRPVTISKAESQSRGLNDTERQLLVETCLGYRLPMDDGGKTGEPWTDTADLYNEWYKAAAWDEGSAVNRLFGFGRDTVTGTDANYLNSGDPFDNGTTPVGYYDGSDHGGVFATSNTANGYGLYDLSGNVAEWVQDYYSSVPYRAVRSGSYAATSAQPAWILNTGRNFAPPELTYGEIGFRFVRVLDVTGDTNGDGQIDLTDYSTLHDCLAGPGNTPDPGCEVIDLDADSDVDLTDFATFQASLGG